MFAKSLQYPTLEVICPRTQIYTLRMRISVFLSVCLSIANPGLEGMRKCSIIKNF